MNANTKAILTMIEALRLDVKAATFAVRGVPRWDEGQTQPKLMRAWDKADERAAEAWSAAAES